MGGQTIETQVERKSETCIDLQAVWPGLKIRWLSVALDTANIHFTNQFKTRQPLNDSILSSIRLLLIHPEVYGIQWSESNKIASVEAQDCIKALRISRFSPEDDLMKKARRKRQEMSESVD